MRRLTTALAVAGMCMVAAACSGKPKTSDAAAEGPLLSAADINTTIGASALTVANTYTEMTDAGPIVADQDCRAIYTPAETSVYADKGITAIRGQALQEPGDNVAHFVRQAVVSFPSATNAGAFFDASTHRWPACADRQFTVAEPGKPDQVWTVGPIADANGMLSTSMTQEGSNGWACQRALTVRNDLAVDVLACSNNPADSAVNIARQITAKIPSA